MSDLFTVCESAVGKKKRKRKQRDTEVRSATIYDDSTRGGYVVHLFLGSQLVGSKFSVDKRICYQYGVLWVDPFHLSATKH